MFDPRSAEVRADPYPSYHALREADPVLHVPSAGLWFLTRHADCVAVLRDPRFSAEHGQRIRMRRTALPPSMLTTDAPTHTRLRAAVAPAFGVAAVRRARPWLEDSVRTRLRHLANLLRTGCDVDVMEEFARPLAAAVLARHLGMPDAELPAFSRWGRVVAANLDPFADPGPAVESAMDGLLARFAVHLHARTADPLDDVFTALASARTAGALAADEALSAAALIVVGGLEPLADLIGNAAATLVTAWRPDAARPRALDQRAARAAVDELVRFDAPVQFTARTALADVDLAGRRIRAGDGVVALLGAANRDPARFAHPDTADLRRHPNPHLSFGAGPHVCLGASLARATGELVLTAAWPSLPLLRPGRTPPVRRTSAVPRGYLTLPLRLPHEALHATDATVTPITADATGTPEATITAGGPVVADAADPPGGRAGALPSGPAGTDRR